MSSRWPLTIMLWKKNLLDKKKFDFYEISDDFDKARNLLCAKLKNEGFVAGIIFTDATASVEEARRSGHKLEDLQPQHIELHYRAWDDPFRGRIVAGGLDSAETMDKYAAELQTQYEKKVFTPNELYALKPIDIYHSLDSIEKWLSEENVCLHNYKLWEEIEKNGLVQLRYLVYEVMGSDESFEIATVWFASNPVAVVTHSGEDNSDRYITDISGWYKMVAYLRTFVEQEEDEKPTTVDADKPLYWLTELDGYHTIHDYYDMERQGKKEKVTA